MAPDALRDEARRIAVEVMRRRRAGEPLTDAAVLAAYPELGECLAEELRKMGLVQRAQHHALRQSPASDPHAHTLQAGLDDALDDRDDDIRMTTLETAAAADVRGTIRARWKDVPDLTRTHLLTEEDLEALEDGFRPESPAVIPPPLESNTVAPAAEPPSPPQAATPQPVATPRTTKDAGAPPETRSSDESQNEAIAPAAEAVRSAARFRPVTRPATPWLRVLDDNQNQGEVIRIRQTSFVIGARVGDLIIAHDSQIDPAHAEIRYEPDRTRWLLRDLNSRTGTFVRVQRLRLRHEDWVMLGRTHLQFRDDPEQGPHLRILPTAAQANGALAPLSPRAAFLIGRAASCDIRMPDVLLDPQHARLTHDASQNRWFLEDLQTLNGVWASIRKVPLQSDSLFQIGEQRFIFSLGP